MSKTIMVAILDCQIVGALDPEQYLGMEAFHPYGWENLIAFLGHSNFDVCDLECDSDLADAMLNKDYPSDILASYEKRKIVKINFVYEEKTRSTPILFEGYASLRETVEKLLLLLAPHVNLQKIEITPNWTLNLLEKEQITIIEQLYRRKSCESH